MVDALRQGIFAGMNVTVPYKRAVMDMAERVDPSAEAVGAANTLVKSRNRIIAYNTDAAGLADELRTHSRGGPHRGRHRIGRRGARGGRGMHGLGANVIAVTSRSWGGSEVARAARAPPTSSGRWGRCRAVGPSPARATAELASLARPSGFSGATSRRARRLIIQATTAGMKGADRGEWLRRSFRGNAYVRTRWLYDLVYNPERRRSYVKARERGLRCVGWDGDARAPRGPRAFAVAQGEARHRA